VFLPIGDDQDHDHAPWTNRVLIAANIAAFVLFCLPHPKPDILERFALHPGNLDPVQLITHMFLHGSIIHLLGNLLFLWIFGRLVEERLGALGWAGFYLLSGLGSAATDLVVAAHGDIPSIGSSGAVSGAIAAVLVFCPRANIKVIYWFFFVGMTMIPVGFWVLLWIIEQAFFASQDIGNVNYWAHLGGFGTGFAAAWLLRELAARLRKPREAPLEPRGAADLAEPRRPFGAAADDELPLDDAVDAYALVYLDAPPADADPRVRATGVLLRNRPRAEAEERRRSVPGTALVADQAANHAAAAKPAESVSWDDRSFRVRIGPESHPVAWSAPRLVVLAEVGPRRFLDVFLSRTLAFRIEAKPGIGLTRVDPKARAEQAASLDDLARAFEERRGVSNGTGRFDDPALYDDYLFRAWNLARAGRKC
jgi:membrane associated rhomboid family serine protease